MTNRLQQLAAATEIVIDSGSLDAITRLQPRDATTNPSLLLKLAESDEGSALRQEATRLATQLDKQADMSLYCDAFATLAGQAISEEIDGLISTEVDARLSFDVPATLARARQLHRIYRELGVEPERILIKLSSTWQGIQAAEVLEQEGIRCNMTLLFNLTQAKAAANAGATLISPFVGRIYDWYRKQGQTINSVDDDPGVQSVKSIHAHYMEHGIDTIIMGASFRNTHQIAALAGCDKLTISPALLDALSAESDDLPIALDRNNQASESCDFAMNETQFLTEMTQDAMATDLLADGIRRFIADQEKLEALFTH